MILLRSLLFNIFLYTGIIIVFLLALPSLLMPPKFTLLFGKFLGHYVIFIVKYILNTKIEIRGLNNIPKTEKYFIASAHQSMFETFALQAVIDYPVFILKKELLKIPLFGLYLRKIKSIEIVRDTTTKDNLNFFKKVAEIIKNENRPLLIFPQGTRVSTNEKIPFKKDCDLDKMFSSYFKYKETEDQLKAIKDVGKLCSSLKITSIEDCSHSYMSYNHFYKSIEDSNFAIYSIRKSLPVYDGGVLRINDNDLNKSFFENADPKTVSLKSQVQLIYMHLKHIAVRYFEFFIIKIKIFNLYSEFITKIKNFVRRDGHETKLYESNDPSHPSILLKSYINNTESEYDIKETIIKNYSEIMSKISELGYKPLYSKLPDKCIPQYAIFYDDSEKLYNFLRNNKIGASRWPDYEMPDQVTNNDSLFPMANFYNKKLKTSKDHYILGIHLRGTDQKITPGHYLPPTIFDIKYYYLN